MHVYKLHSCHEFRLGFHVSLKPASHSNIARSLQKHSAISRYWGTVSSRFCVLSKLPRSAIFRLCPSTVQVHANRCFGWNSICDGDGNVRAYRWCFFFVYRHLRAREAEMRLPKVEILWRAERPTVPRVSFLFSRRFIWCPSILPRGCLESIFLLTVPTLVEN